MSRRPSTKPRSGMRDFLPRDIARRRHVVETVRRVYERYGFVPLETPAVESLAVLLGKYGEDEKLIYRLLHRGEALSRALSRVDRAADLSADDLSEEALRYDLTVPLARVVAQYGDLPRYFKRYQIQPVWRADRPGKGRFREFYQCDVDALGSEGPVAEAEIVAAVSEALSALGLAAHTFHVHHRALLRRMLEAAGVPAPLAGSALQALDKIDKIGRDGVAGELDARGVPAGAARALLDMVQPGSGGAAPKEAVADLAGRIGGEAPGAERLADLFDLLEATAAAGKIRFDPSLARGLGYYTGVIFEARIPGYGFSVAGGGRYDDLVGIFGKRKVPAVGCSIGLERILVILEEKGLFPDLPVGPDLLLCWFDVPPRTALATAARLRNLGLRVEVYPDRAKLGKQIAYAAQPQVGARLAAVLGPDEVAAGTVTLKHLATGRQETVALDGVRAFLEALDGAGGGAP